MKTMSNLCLNHLSQKIRLSQQSVLHYLFQGSAVAKVPALAITTATALIVILTIIEVGQKHLRQQDFNREIKSLAVVIHGHELGLPITLDANFLNIPDASAGGYERSRQPVRESIGKNSFRPFQRCSGRWQARLSRRETVHSIHGLRCGSLESRNHRPNRRWQTRLGHGRRNRRE